MFLWNHDGLAGSGIAAFAPASMTRRESAKASELNPSAFFQRLDNTFENDRDHAFGFFPGEIGIVFVDFVDEF